MSVSSPSCDSVCAVVPSSSTIVSMSSPSTIVGSGGEEGASLDCCEYVSFPWLVS